MDIYREKDRMIDRQIYRQIDKKIDQYQKLR